MPLSIEGFPSAILNQNNRSILKTLKNLGVLEVFIPVQDPQAATDVIMGSAVKVLQDLGFKPVPHVPVRKLETDKAFKYLEMLINERVVKVLMIGGDTPHASGHIDSSLDLVTELSKRNKLPQSVAFAAHPEGHAILNEAELLRVIREKERFASVSTTSIEYVTQMLFSAEKTRQWLDSTQVTRPISLSFSIPVSTWQKLQHARILKMRMQSVFWGFCKSFSSPGNPDRIMEIILENPEQLSPHIFAFGGLEGIRAFIASSKTIGQYLEQCK